MSEYNAEREVSLTLTSADWLLLQEAVDTEIYETEHQGPWTKKPHRETQRQERLARLLKLNRLIASATGYGTL